MEEQERDQGVPKEGQSPYVCQEKPGSSFARGSGRGGRIILGGHTSRLLGLLPDLQPHVPPTAAARWLSPCILIKCRLGANK